MFHASILRMPLSASVDGVTYNMQVVHEVGWQADGELKAVHIIRLTSEGEPDIQTLTDISQLNAVQPTSREDAIALQQVQQHIQQIGFTLQDLQAAALRMQLVRLLGKYHSPELTKQQLSPSDPLQHDQSNRTLQQYSAQMDELIEQYTRLMRLSKANEQQQLEPQQQPSAPPAQPDQLVDNALSQAAQRRQLQQQEHAHTSQHGTGRHESQLPTQQQSTSHSAAPSSQHQQRLSCDAVGTVCAGGQQRHLTQYQLPDQQQTQLPAHQQQQQQGWLGTQQLTQQPLVPSSSPPMSTVAASADVPAAAATPGYLRPCVSYSRRPAHLNNKAPVVEHTRYPDGQLPAGMPAWGPECKICYRQIHTLVWSGTINWCTADGQKSGSFEACGHLYLPSSSSSTISTISSPQLYWQRYHYLPPVLAYVVNTPAKGFESGLWRQPDEQVPTADHAAALAEGWDVAPLLLVPQKSADKSSAAEFMQLLRGANKILSGTHLASSTVDLTAQQGVIGHSFISYNPSGPLMRYLESQLPEAARSHWCIQNQQQQKCIAWGVLRDSSSPVCIATFSWFKAATGEPDAPVGQQQIIQQAAAAAGQLKQELQQQEQQLQQLGWTVAGKQKVPQLVQQNQQQQQQQLQQQRAPAVLGNSSQHKQSVLQPVQQNQQQQAPSLQQQGRPKQAPCTAVGAQPQPVSPGKAAHAAATVGSSRYGYQQSSALMALAAYPGRTDAAAPVPPADAASGVAAQPAAAEDYNPAQLNHSGSASFAMDRKRSIHTESPAGKRSRHESASQVGVEGPHSSEYSKEQQASSSKLRSRSRSRERHDSHSSQGRWQSSRSRSRSRGAGRDTGPTRSRSRSSSRTGTKAVTEPSGRNSKWDGTSQTSTKGSLLHSNSDPPKLPCALDCALSAVEVKQIYNPGERDELRCLALLLVCSAVATISCTAQPATGAAAATECPAKAVSVELASEPRVFAAAKVALRDVEQLMPGVLAPSGCSWRDFCSNSNRCPVLLVVGEADLQACPRFMLLVRRHKLLRRLCVQLMTEMRRVYGPQAGVTPTQLEGLMRKQAVLMLYRQLYDTTVNFISDMLSGGAEQLVRGPDRQHFLLPKDLAAAAADKHAPVSYKVPRGYSTMRDVKLGSGWIGDAGKTPGKQQQTFEKQQQQLVQQSTAAVAMTAGNPKAAASTAGTLLGNLFDSPKRQQQQQALKPLAGQLSTGSSIDEQTIASETAKPAAATGGLKIVLGKNATVMSKLGSGKAGCSTAASGGSGTAAAAAAAAASGKWKRPRAGPIISAILTAGSSSGSKKSKGFVMIDEMGLPSSSPATNPPAAGKAGSGGRSSRQPDVAGPATLAAANDSRAADVTDTTDSAVTQSDYARYSTALQQMDATYLTKAELDQLRSIALLHEVAQWVDPAQTEVDVKRKPQLELACQPECVLDKKVPVKFLYLPPSLRLEEECSMAQFVGTDRCSLLSGVGDGKVQAVKNYMTLMLGQHTIPQKLLPVLVKRLQESRGNSGDLQQPLYMTPELCATAERLMETEPRLQPLLVYRKLYTSGLGSFLADFLPQADLLLLRNDTDTYAIATPALSQQPEFQSFHRVYFRPPNHSSATRAPVRPASSAAVGRAAAAAAAGGGPMGYTALSAWPGCSASMHPYHQAPVVATTAGTYSGHSPALAAQQQQQAHNHSTTTAAGTYLCHPALAAQQHHYYASATGYAQAVAAYTQSCSAQPQLPPGYEGYAAAYAAAGTAAHQPAPGVTAAAATALQVIAQAGVKPPVQPPAPSAVPPTCAVGPAAHLPAPQPGPPGMTAVTAAQQAIAPAGVKPPIPPPAPPAVPPTCAVGPAAHQPTPQPGPPGMTAVTAATAAQQAIAPAGVKPPVPPPAPPAAPPAAAAVAPAVAPPAAAAAIKPPMPPASAAPPASQSAAARAASCAPEAAAAGEEKAGMRDSEAAAAAAAGSEQGPSAAAPEEASTAVEQARIAASEVPPAAPAAEQAGVLLSEAAAVQALVTEATVESDAAASAAGRPPVHPPAPAAAPAVRRSISPAPQGEAVLGPIQPVGAPSTGDPVARNHRSTPAPTAAVAVWPRVQLAALQAPPCAPPPMRTVSRSTTPEPGAAAAAPGIFRPSVPPPVPPATTPAAAGVAAALPAPLYLGPSPASAPQGPVLALHAAPQVATLPQQYHTQWQPHYAAAGPPYPQPAAPYGCVQPPTPSGYAAPAAQPPPPAALPPWRMGTVAAAAAPPPPPPPPPPASAGRATTPEPSDNARYADEYYAKLWPILEILDVSCVSESEADDLRSLALLHSMQKVLAARPTGTLVRGVRRELELACQPQSMMTAVLPFEELQLPAVLMPPGASIKEFITSGRSSLLQQASFDENMVQVTPNYMSVVINKHQLPKRLLTQLVQKLQRKYGNDHVRLNQDCRDYIEDMLLTDKVFQLLTPYRQLYYYFGGLKNMLADLLPGTGYVLIRPPSAWPFQWIILPQADYEQWYKGVAVVTYTGTKHFQATRAEGSISDVQQKQVSVAAVQQAMGDAAE